MAPAQSAGEGLSQANTHCCYPFCQKSWYATVATAAVMVNQFYPRYFWQTQLLQYESQTKGKGSSEW